MNRTGTTSTAPAVSATLSPETSPVEAFCRRNYVWLALGVLAVAAFNLVFRLQHEIVTEWDESLYATTAWEIVKSGRWVATTFHGQLDYYNCKPPLNVWLIAASFKAFGVSLLSLRLHSVVSALATVGLLMAWARRQLGAAVALLSGLILGTLFAYLYVHASRSGNTDALFVLAFTVIGIALCEPEDSMRRFAWLGPGLAVLFMLRGLALLMPLAFIVPVVILTPPRGLRAWLGILLGVVLLVAPVGAWAYARYQVDQWVFFHQMVKYDFVARTVTVIEEHQHEPWFYLNVLVKHHFEWLIAAALAVTLGPKWKALRLRMGEDVDRRHAIVLATWVLVTLVVPTVMRTKLPWYLNTFYPPFALAMAWTIVRASAMMTPRRAAIVGAVIVVGLLSVEARLYQYSLRYRDLGRFTQGLLLAEGPDRLAGHRVFRARWDRAEIFVIRAMLGAERGLAAGVDDFAAQARPGDYFVTAQPLQDPRVAEVRTQGSLHLFRRR